MPAVYRTNVNIKILVFD